MILSNVRCCKAAFRLLSASFCRVQACRGCRHRNLCRNDSVYAFRILSNKGSLLRNWLQWIQEAEYRILIPTSPIQDPLLSKSRSILSTLHRPLCVSRQTRFLPPLCCRQGKMLSIQTLFRCFYSYFPLLPISFRTIFVKDEMARFFIL